MLSDLEIKKQIIENKIKTIYLQFVDILGRIKTLELPSSQIDAILKNDVMFDGSSIGGFRDNETMDLRLFPDKETFLVFPFEFPKLKNTARFICDIHNADGSPFEGCPRSNLKRVVNSAREQNYNMQIGPEIEFFLLKMEEQKISFSGSEKTGYYDVNQSHKYDDALMNMLVTLQDLGYDIEAIHHEGAPFQHEVDLGHDDIIKAADNLISFKFIAKTVANNYGFKVSFMPKPIYGQNGSGLHLNISLYKDDQNVFFDRNALNKLSDNALYSIGSILKNIKGITAILNPTVNSYKRLVKDYEAPIYIVWSDVTRSALVRVPSKRGQNTRLELRSPDCATNPYLAFAVILQTCLDGIRNKVDPPRPVEKNLFALSGNEIKQRKIKSLPRNMFTALEELEKSLLAKVALGDYIYREFIDSKKIEWNDYRKQVTPWELKKYLDV